MKKFHLNKPLVFISAFWIMLGVTLWSQLRTDYPSLNVIGPPALIVLCAAIIAHTLSNVLLPIALKKGTMQVFVLQSFAATTVLTAAIAAVFYGTYWLTIHGTPYDNETQLEQNKDFLVVFLRTIPSALLIIGSTCGFQFYQEHYKMAQKHTLLQQAHLEAQLRILQDQINPHLMFNVLNHLHILMKKDVDLASTLLVKFSEILRYQLYECNRETITLEKEVTYLKNLVAVEKIRWGDELQVDCIWSITNGKRDIVPLLLVPFVENAFKHVSRLPSEKGFVRLSLNQENELLTFSIENSNSPKPARKNESSGLGLENVKQRLQILYPGQHDLQVTRSDTHFKVVLVIHLDQKVNYVGY
ncbi:sensor histidine kinase [Pedobacter gandavensis]|uniref:GHKL domain-containing protein n=1 Tax=Pedobacter gandavensis TaxID=2679963 RepID=A0ABR6EZC7_9SPHI|nr:histidine kinase [Pedobacter gandavensis]MBB2150635.1 GHKL domain-containing protein [Pedobacter gandavensis]